MYGLLLEKYHCHPVLFSISMSDIGIKNYLLQESTIISLFSELCYLFIGMRRNTEAVRNM
jgi:hypothetical protein